MKNPRVRAGLLGGVLGGVMVLISLELVIYVAALLAGTVAGLVASYTEPQRNRVAGVRQGIQAGLIAGALVLVGKLIREVALDPLLRQPVDVGAALMLGLGGVVVCGVTSGLFGVVRTLPGRASQIGTYALLGVLALAYPWLDQFFQLRFMNEITPVLVFVLMALGLNIVVGYAGLLDLGYAAFFAIGAYATGMVASPHMGISLSFWLAIWIAAASAAVFGVILGAPTLRLRGDYLAIVTLGFGEIVPIAANNLDKFSLSILGFELFKDFDLTGGPKGINPINRPELPFIGEFRPDQPIPWYYLILAIMIFSMFFILRLRDSRIGRAWMAMREDELAASAMGINLVQTKLWAFAMGATFSGFAGAFYGAYISAIFPSSFRFDVSVMLLCMVILGGMGNMTGVIIGGLLIQLTDRLFLPQFSQMVQRMMEGTQDPILSQLNFASDFRLMLFGMILVVMMLVRPEGILPNERRRAELHGADAAPLEERAPVEAAGSKGAAS